jgi:1-acyl-sn-glycerol-3-phosphate acyltransferase
LRTSPEGARALYQFFASWLFSLGYAVLATVAVVLTLGRFAHTLTPWLLKGWGRVMLAIAGIELEVSGAERLHVPSGKVAIFNHASFLDAPIITAIMPAGSVAAIKREVLFYPVVGVAMFLLGFLFIDRGRGERARRTLDRAASRVQAEKLTVFIAPEGTRSEDGGLLPFKKGAFHLAVRSGAPIVPVLIEGAFDQHPYGRLWTRPGKIRVRVLEPIPTAGMTPEQVPALVERARAVYAAPP